MPYENLVALHVTDDVSYTEYRAKMTPILETYGGGFSADFRISEVLKAPTDAPINRVFTIYFRDKSAMEAFFADPAYLAVKAQYFTPAVAHTTILASYERDSASTTR